MSSIADAIRQLSRRQDLTYDEAEGAMDEIMSGKCTPVAISAYLTALSMRSRPRPRRCAPTP